MADTNSMSQHLEQHDHEGPEYWFRKAPKTQQKAPTKIEKKGAIPRPTGRRFQNKVAIVTESADGIGFSIAERLAMEGAIVVITSSNGASLGEATEKLKGKKLDVVPITCDVSSPQGRKDLINQTLEKYKKINVLVSNAATGPRIHSISETEGNLLDKLWEVNVKTHLLLFMDAKQHLENGSSVVFVSSAPSDLPQAARAAHDTTKTVLTGLTKALSEKLNPENVRVNSVVTGFEMPSKSKKGLWWKKRKTIPDRIGTTDMASVAAFLASDHASKFSGETSVIHGGINSKL